MTPDDKRLQNMYLLRSLFNVINTYIELNDLNKKYPEDILLETMTDIHNELLTSNIYVYYKDDESGYPLFVPFRGLWTADDTRRSNIMLDSKYYLDMERVNHSTPIVSEQFTDDDAITFRELMMYCSSVHPEIYKIYETMNMQLHQNVMMMQESDLQYLLGTYVLHASCVDIFDNYVVSPFINQLCGVCNIHVDQYEELSLRFMNTLALNKCSSELLENIYVEAIDDPTIKYLLVNIYNSYKLGDIEHSTLSNMMSRQHDTPYMTFKVAGCCTKLIGVQASQ